MRKMYKVFIVDDEPFIIEGLYDILDWTALGLEIVGHAENGLQAMEAMAFTPVDVLITDISMPVMDGLSLIGEARKRQRDLKVIILSGYNEFDYLKQGMRLGIENYLLKPINVDELESTLRNTVDKLDSTKSSRLYSAFDVQILKDNTLYRWMNRQIAPAEFMERADLLGVRLDRPYMVAAVLRATSDGSVFELADHLLEGYPGMTRFRDVDGDAVLITSMEDGQSEKTRLMEALDKLGLALEEQGTAVHIGVGTVVGKPEEVPDSYREAKQSLEYFMVLPDRRLIDYAGLEEIGGGPKRHVAIAWDEYAKLILAKDEKGLIGRIRDDFEHMQQSEHIRPEDLHSAAFELVIRFKMELEQIKHSDESGIFMTGLDKVRESASLESLIRSLQEVAKATVQSLLQDMKNPVVSQVLVHIHNHYADELSLKTLGAQYHIHPVYLGQLFHKETGETFAEYINKFRIEKAKQQLKNTNLKVQEIARNVGYWETGYFYKQFRKYVGISPTDYKGLG